MKTSKQLQSRAIISVLTLGAVVLLFTPSSAVAGIIENVSTGLDASDNLITSGGQNDAHWTVDMGSTNSTGIAQTIYPGNSDWYGGWLSNGPDSGWIARNANVTNNGPASYSFYTTFDLSGYDPTTASFTVPGPLTMLEH